MGPLALERAVTGLTSKFRTQKSGGKELGFLARDYPTDAESYELLEECGRGVSASVHKVLCKPLHELMAVKKMNLEALTLSLDDIIQETATMRNYNHPNVLPLYTSFVDKAELWMVMPLITGGSVQHIMKYSHPEGLDEVCIATIMRDVLKALDYVHRQGSIHRDLKAGNILVDNNGCVYLADFGVSTSGERGGSWGNNKCTRMTFVGTPCWMAPEVMEQTAGYDNAADIWSFGITLLELAHGHAPFAKFSPMKVLLMTLQNPPPTLDDKGTKTFSKAMRNLVTRCLQKDPRLRPTASQLLDHKFFKIARDEDYLAKNLLSGLPPLEERVKEINQGGRGVRQNNAENVSNEEYKKGVSSWNFDVGALKAQAEMEPDDLPSLTTIPEIDDSDTLSSCISVPSLPSLSTSSMSKPTPLSFTSAVRGLTHTASMPHGPNGSIMSFSMSNGLSVPRSSAPQLNAGHLLLSTQDLNDIDGGDVSSPNTVLATESSVGLGLSTRKGRFQIYNSGSEPPSESTLAAAAAAAVAAAVKAAAASGKEADGAAGTSAAAPPAASGSATSAWALPEGATTAMTAAPATTRILSEEGIRRDDAPTASSGLFSYYSGCSSLTDDPLDGARLTASYTPAATATLLPSVASYASNLSTASAPAAAEPKKKGRFVITETSGGGANEATPSLPEKRVSDSGARPPLHPLSGGGFAAPLAGGALPASFVLPKLYDLLEQASLHQEAIQKLVAAVVEAERGRPLRSTSKKPSQPKAATTPDILSPRSRGSGSTSAGGSTSAWGWAVPPPGSTDTDKSSPPSADPLAHDAVDAVALRARLAEATAENCNLRLRNHLLESLMGSSHATRRVGAATSGASSEHGDTSGGGRSSVHLSGTGDPLEE